MKRMGSILMVMAGILILCSPVLADSINPVGVGGTLGVGASATITKSVTVNAGTPTSSLVDVFFLADTTGSMGGTIAAVQAGASSILSATSGLGDVAWGVGAYRDVGDIYEYNLFQAITTNTALVQAGIGSWTAGGGGDAAEAQLQALQMAATQEATAWRTGSARIIAWFGDYWGHDPSGSTLVTEAEATAALTGAHIKVEALNVGAGYLDYTGQATRITAATGGALYNGIDTAHVVDAIINAITTSFETYSSVSLDTSEVPAGIGVSFTPGSYVGSYDRSIDRTFNFSVTYTGVTPGTYDFSIYGTVDGARVATEYDSIVVPGTAVPEPSTFLLLGTGLLVAGSMGRKKFGKR